MFNSNGTYTIDWTNITVTPGTKKDESLLSKIDKFVFSFGVLTVVRLWSIAAIITTAYAISASIIK